MSVLKNPRHELFAQLLAEGKKYAWSNGACYSRAGYRAEGRAAEANASRLPSNANNGVAGRVQEIVGAGARRAEVTVQSLLEELDQVLAGAVGDKQYGAARAAIDSKARLKGLFTDRLEVGRVGSFDECRSVDEVVDRLIEGSGSAAQAHEALLEMASWVEQRAAETARPVPAPSSEKAKTGGRSEAERSFALFRK